jgi:hypothetical protein
MGNPLLLLLSAVFIASSAILLLLSQKRRDIVLKRLHLRRRRASGSKTPPRSLSPENKQQEEPANADFSDIFPPSRLFTLAHIAEFASKPRKTREKLKTEPEKNNCLPLTTELKEAEKHFYTPCGFSVEEIDALGDFPDYATLSGVPLPHPYHDFDINKARPRPYRPFRWAYHQTMCMFVQGQALTVY